MLHLYRVPTSMKSIFQISGWAGLSKTHSRAVLQN